MSFQDSIDRLEENSQAIEDVVNGPASGVGSTVTLPNLGTQDTLAKMSLQFDPSYPTAFGVISADSLAIGTDDPAQDPTGSADVPLHIKGSTMEVLRIESAGQPRARWVQNGTDAGMIQFGLNGGYISQLSGGPLVFKLNGENKMYIESGGDVGIGTSNPQSKLDVSGTVTAESFNLKSGGRLNIQDLPNFNGQSQAKGVGGLVTGDIYRNGSTLRIVL